MQDREIKFRAWAEKKEKKFDGETTFKGYMTKPFSFDAFDEDYFIPDGIYLDDMKIMQFTGLKDSNDVEAYDKDRVSAKGYSNWTIVWAFGGWKIKQDDVENYHAVPDEFVITGNVFENP